MRTSKCRCSSLMLSCRMCWQDLQILGIIPRAFPVPIEASVAALADLPTDPEPLLKSLKAEFPDIFNDQLILPNEGQAYDHPFAGELRPHEVPHGAADAHPPGGGCHGPARQIPRLRRHRAHDSAYGMDQPGLLRTQAQRPRGEDGVRLHGT
jgi:hypothetical protein